ncbi:Abi family protein [Nocardia exalbida]|uniref:Abi family protein n=1 Tax=Nocardia TaxID=1817 RepID=UPI000688DF7B|nr:Abi family protein [Nocardia exalbida]
MPDLTAWVTRRRFDEYLVAANHDPDAARDLYEWNVAISAAFFELISHVEVALRNAIDAVLQRLEVLESARVDLSQGWWFANPAFLTDHDLEFHRTARRHLGARADGATRDKVLSSMTFGLWLSVFGPKYEQLFRKHLVHAFPNRQKVEFRRDTVHRNVLALKNLRNRIAHHQAIFDLPLEERFEQAMDLLRWIDADLERWVTGLCRVPDLLNERPEAAESIAVIVPARKAWPLYEQHSAYVCQPGRFFRQISHIGFYADAALQREIPKVLERIDPVVWTPEEIGRRMGSGKEDDRRIAEIIKGARALGWAEDEYQLFLLTRPDAEGLSRGHVTLPGELRRQSSGRGSAWVQRQRYVAVAALQSARTLGDLDQQ